MLLWRWALKIVCRLTEALPAYLTGAGLPPEPLPRLFRCHHLGVAPQSLGGAEHKGRDAKAGRWPLPSAPLATMSANIRLPSHGQRPVARAALPCCAMPYVRG